MYLGRQGRHLFEVHPLSGPPHRDQGEEEGLNASGREGGGEGFGREGG